MSPRSLPFYQVDVFTTTPYKGNPVAVVVALDPAIQISDESMATFANWTNLSETTFLLPPSDPSKADYKVRIFTTSVELPFAGHPTIGTCKVFLEIGGQSKTKGKVIQECGLGLIQLRLGQDESISFTAPTLRKSGKVDQETLSIACQAMKLNPDSVLSADWIVNGPDWFAIELKDAKAVLEVECQSIDKAGQNLDWGIWGAYPDGQHDADYRSEDFFDFAQVEDPATGSFAAGLAVNRPDIAKDGRFAISQGTKLGRQSRIKVARQEDAGKIWIGGHATVCISGKVTI